MANTPQHPSNPPPVAPGAVAPTTPAYPGGMASDPANALANEIVTNIRGSADRLRSRIESNPALKAALEQGDDDLVASVAQSIRRAIDAEVAKATGGFAPSNTERKPS
jgi:hypothetical protein